MGGGKFRFRLKAGNGEIIASSEAYESKANAKNGIASCFVPCSDLEVMFRNLRERNSSSSETANQSATSGIPEPTAAQGF
jgi:hypothetical protein